MAAKTDNFRISPMSASNNAKNICETLRYMLLDTINPFLSSKSPFDDDSSLHSIDTGVTAGDSVNVDNVVNVGKKILDGMVGQKVLEYVFKKKYQVITLGAKTAVKTQSLC